MFFIGATGQLLTLILTVCLPFVLLLSGNQNITISNSLSHFEVQQIHQDIDYSDDIKSFSENNVKLIEYLNGHLFIKNRIHKKIPVRDHDVTKSIFYIDGTGNKAPPLFLHC